MPGNENITSAMVFAGLRTIAPEGTTVTGTKASPTITVSPGCTSAIDGIGAGAVMRICGSTVTCARTSGVASTAASARPHENARVLVDRFIPLPRI